MSTNRTGMSVNKAPNSACVRRPQTTMMIARTDKGDPVWQTDGKGRPFIIDHKDGQTIIPVGRFWRWKWWPLKGRVRMLPEPHLSWHQVANANEKGKIILKALRNGPIYVEKGFLKGRDRKILTTRAVTGVVLHWLEGCGVVFTKRPLKDGRIQIDIDVEATNKNNVK